MARRVATPDSIAPPRLVVPPPPQAQASRGSPGGIDRPVRPFPAHAGPPHRHAFSFFPFRCFAAGTDSPSAAPKTKQVSAPPGGPTHSRSDPADARQHSSRAAHRPASAMAGHARLRIPGTGARPRTAGSRGGGGARAPSGGARALPRMPEEKEFLRDPLRPVSAPSSPPFPLSHAHCPHPSTVTVFISRVVCSFL